MLPNRSLNVFLVMLCGVGLVSAQTPKADKYPFRVSPLVMYAKMEKLEGVKLEPLPKGDAELLEKLWKYQSEKDAKAPDTHKEMATLFLIASGVPVKDREDYMKKLDKLEREARAALIVHKNDSDLAEKLLVYLHKGVMCKGYQMSETNVQGLFEKNQFNCVSSSAVYYLIGTRMGLKLQPLLIAGKPGTPGHATVDMLDGKDRIKIETTSIRGFDFDRKIKAAKDAGLKVNGKDIDRTHAYDTDGFGLAGSMASNLNGANSKPTSGQLAEAVRFGLISLVLAPDDVNSVDNFKAAIVNCGLSMIEKKDYENAVGYHKLMREFVGHNDLLEKNYRAVWERYLAETYEAENVELGAKLLKQASVAFTNEKSFENANKWLIIAAQKARDKSGWKVALDLIDRGSKDIPLAEMKELNAWKSSARRIWSQDLLKAEDVEGAFKVLCEGLKETPNDSNLLEGLKLSAYRSLSIMERKEGLKGAAEKYKKWKAEFPTNKGISDAGFFFAMDAIKPMMDAKKYEDAIKRCVEYREFAGDRLDDLKAQAFDGKGQSLIKEKRWENAFNHYKDALKECANHKGLTQNAVYSVDQWAKESMNKKDWNEAIKIYERGLEYFPENSLFKQNIRYCEQEKKR